jgi:hypothetical protein
VKACNSPNERYFDPRWSIIYRSYDRRTWIVQSVVAAVVLPLSYLLGDSEKNVNGVYGFGDEPQTWLHPRLFVLILMLAFPTCVYLPSHLLPKRLMLPV